MFMLCGNGYIVDVGGGGGIREYANKLIIQFAGYSDTPYMLPDELVGRNCFFKTKSIANTSLNNVTSQESDYLKGAITETALFGLSKVFNKGDIREKSFFAIVNNKELYYALYKTQSAGTTTHGWNKGTKRFSASVEIFW